MFCEVIAPFKRRGELQLPGSIIEVPEDVFPKLAGFVQAVATVDSPTPSSQIVTPHPVTDWRPEFKAWLTSEGGLRTTGVCDDLAIEIIKLTSDNLPLQVKLLRLHVGTYSGPYWLLMVRRWRERARVLFEAEGLGLHEANWIAAEEMNLLAFADELHLKQPA